MSSYGRIYYVTFEIRKGGKVLNCISHCWAWDAKEAKELTKLKWEKKGREERLFKLYAHRSRAFMDKQLKVVGWNGATFYGKTCIDQFICTEITGK